MKTSKKSCAGCIWEDACDGANRCEHYTPADDSLEIEEYERDLVLRAATYENFVKEQQR